MPTLLTSAFVVVDYGLSLSYAVKGGERQSTAPFGMHSTATGRPDMRNTALLTFWLFLPATIWAHTTAKSKPNIIFIIADDLGWNDVGFHGSNQIPTPNIDALACSGIILNNYYVTPLCTPSRSALMTGKYPIHTGMQHRVLFGAEPRGLPLSEKLLPQYLQELGYNTHIVGKWHLGSYTKEYTPTYRGFESHLGYWTGHQDYNDHTACETNMWGLDMRRNLDAAWDLHGQYSTDVFTTESVRLIHKHNQSHPLFLYIAHAAVHSGNPYNPLPAPDNVVAKFKYIDEYNRQRFAGMLNKLDDSVGEVAKALKEKKMLQNSIIVFTTDNGGPAEGFNLNAASNWPLRGVKNTLWEGGVRGAAFIWSPLIPNASRISSGLMHITDWLPTLVSAASGRNGILKSELDGINLWESLLMDTPTNRSQVLHNIDDLFGNAALTIDDWKIVKGTTHKGQWDNWYGPSGRPDGHLPAYNATMVVTSPAGNALAALGKPVQVNKIMALREEAEVVCTTPEQPEPCFLLEAPCLFNIRNDPCEYNNLAHRYPAVLRHLEKILTELNRTALPPGNLPVDPRGDPRFWDHTWNNFGDYSIVNNDII